MEESYASTQGRRIAESMSHSAPAERVRTPQTAQAAQLSDAVEVVYDEVRLTITLLEAACAKLKRVRSKVR